MKTIHLIYCKFQNHGIKYLFSSLFSLRAKWMMAGKHERLGFNETRNLKLPYIILNIIYLYEIAFNYKTSVLQYEIIQHSC